MNDTLARLPAEDIEAQRARLAALDEVYVIRIERAEREMQSAIGERDELDALLSLLRDDLARVDEQRRLWSRRWQEWLAGGGAIHQGRSFTQRHAELSALERILLEHRTEIGAQRQHVQQRVELARAEWRRLLRQREAVAERSRRLRQALDAQHESRQDEIADERILARWHRGQVSAISHHAARGAREPLGVAP